MSTTKCTRALGRPRSFGSEVAVAKVQPLFHARDYDVVGVVDVAAALSIKPPSFYAASGSKIGLYRRILDRYIQAEAIPLDDILRLDKSVSECLTNPFEGMVRRYAADPYAPGCLVLEGTHSNDPQAKKVARNFYSVTEYRIHGFIVQRHPKEADSLTNYVSATVLDLSGKAHCGHSFECLLASTRIVNVAVRHQPSK